MRVLTGLDLPADAPGGSVELLRDLYLDPDSSLRAQAFMLPPTRTTGAAVYRDLTLLAVEGKALTGRAFRSYVERLSHAVTAEFPLAGTDVVHLQHLAFGATPALLRAVPDRPAIALVHGTDLLFAARHPTQAEVLRTTVQADAAVVVPTTAMADRLEQFFPGGIPTPVVHVPWGVPDRLLDRRPRRPALRPDVLRVLYAGRLTAEKVMPQLLMMLTGLPEVELRVAAPADQFAQLVATTGLPSSCHAGWFPRDELWAEFGRHDLLIVPSVDLEAFGLVAVEAQACGLPVAYQPVPGLREVLGRSALPVDFRDLHAAAAEIRRLAGSPTRLAELAAAGRANSARYSISETRRALLELSAEVTR